MNVLSAKLGDPWNKAAKRRRHAFVVRTMRLERLFRSLGVKHHGMASALMGLVSMGWQADVVTRVMLKCDPTRKRDRRILQECLGVLSQTALPDGALYVPRLKRHWRELEECVYRQVKREDSEDRTKRYVQARKRTG